jgi:uncharacterized protein (DUF1684 family)
MNKIICAVVLGGAVGVAAAGCARQTWPDPPALDRTKYQADYETWRQQRQETAQFALSIRGIWPLQQGDTAFGSDPSLAIVLPGSPARAGVFTRTGDTVTVKPQPAAPLRIANGGPVTAPTTVPVYEMELALGSVRLQLQEMGEESPKRLYVMAWDEEHPAAKTGAAVQAYPIDDRWRVTARFDALDSPKPVTVSDVRGGNAEFLALGRLVFRIDGNEHTLTAFGEPGGDEFFVMFKDETNQITTYGGYRIVAPRAVKNGEWTVLDFNLALNPPCAYSTYTTCPLPPPENRLDIAIEAGEMRHPTAQGFAG